MSQKPSLSMGKIWNMCFGFLGIQFGMGLQLANMSPIFRYLGADEHSLPLLWLAGPVTGLIIQPIIGAMGDNTWGKWGRRRPYFTIGAIIASIILVLMPYSSVVWMAAGFMWILDAATNTSMESFRAMVGDILPRKQQSLGFSLQAFMLGIGQLISSVLPYILTLFGFAMVAGSNEVPDFVKYAFFLGALTILISVLWTGHSTKEYPPEDLEEFNQNKARAGIVKNTIKEIFESFSHMPLAMRQMWWVKLFSWYAIPLMWQYLSLSIARHVFHSPSPNDPGFSDGVAMGGVAAAIFSTAPMIVAFLFTPLIRKIGNRKTYAFLLFIGALGFFMMQFTESLPVVFGLCFMIGVGFSSMITMPFIIISAVISPTKMGVNMGLLNTFICIPQILSMLTIPLIYDTILMGDPRNCMVLAGILWVIAAILISRITKTVEHPVIPQTIDEN